MKWGRLRPAPGGSLLRDLNSLQLDKIIALHLDNENALPSRSPFVLKVMGMPSTPL